MGSLRFRSKNKVVLGTQVMTRFSQPNLYMQHAASQHRHKVVHVLSAMVYFWLCLAVTPQAWKLQTFRATRNPSNMVPAPWSFHRLVVAHQCMTRSSEW